MAARKRIQYLEELIISWKNIPEPSYRNPKKFKQKVRFLQEVRKQPYPTRWYQMDKKRTQTIFEREYAKWLREYQQKHNQWERIQQQIKQAELEKKRLVERLENECFLDEMYEYQQYMQEVQEQNYQRISEEEVRG